MGRLRLHIFSQCVLPGELLIKHNRETIADLLLVALSEIRFAPIGQRPRKSKHADHCALSAIEADTVSLHLQLPCPVRLYVVAQLFGSQRWQESWQVGR